MNEVKCLYINEVLLFYLFISVNICNRATKVCAKSQTEIRWILFVFIYFVFFYRIVQMFKYIYM